MNESTVMYVVVDCYPSADSPHFRNCVSAAAGCWIRGDLAETDIVADELIRQKLSREGWSVARTLLREQVTAETYADKAEGRDYFRQALVDGFVAQFHVVSRQSVGDSELSDEAIAHALVDVAAAIGRDGATSLFSPSARQWANGVLGEGDEFLPLWVDAASAAAWLPDWPGYELRQVTKDELQNGRFLDEVRASDMSLALGVGKTLLTTCHPLWLKEISGRSGT